MRPRSFDPVLKWAGGKRQLLPQILQRLPAKIATYYEPFVGGGAVFFALSHEQRFTRAVLTDQNPDLIAVYQALQSDLESLIDKLRVHDANHCEDYYYEVRENHRLRAPSARAARMIYLNKTGFNGLYRVNRSGKFNVPFGRYDKPRILDEPRLRAAHQALTRVEVEIELADFEKACKKARRGDAVYLDPPYLPVSDTAHFAAYHNSPFGIEEHERLARVFSSLSTRGVHALLSNSDTSDTQRLFGEHRLEIVKARRSINSVKSRRGPIGEILVST
ncbi:MAG: DNA adenine methylase [Polyangiaceae bacterium]